MSKKAFHPHEALNHGEGTRQNMYDLKELRKAMKEVQTSKRFEHTKGVEYICAALAMRYGASMEVCFMTAPSV